VLLMDHLSSHKVAGVREAVEAAGATLRYLPSYSPDLNRSSRSSQNSRPCCEPAIGRLLGCFPAAECARYLAHCGYGQSG
jgi:DDE superfamily endonuclease